jgi:hypothetical protein
LPFDYEKLLLAQSGSNNALDEVVDEVGEAGVVRVFGSFGA